MTLLPRADSIVRDAEALRQELLPGDGAASRWAVLGQSFGGFCSLTYLSFAPEGAPHPVRLMPLILGLLCVCLTAHAERHCPASAMTRKSGRPLFLL